MTPSNSEISHRIGHLAGIPTRTQHWTCDANYEPTSN